MEIFVNYSQAKLITAEAKPFLEILNYSFSLLVPIVGILALRQITIAKNDIELRSERESISLALGQYDRYISHILPEYNEIFNILDEEHFELYKGEIKGFDQDNFTGATRCWVDTFNELYSENKPVIQTVLTFINNLEQFAIVFIKAKANTDTVFSSIGSHYCKMVEGVYPMILSLRSASANHPPYDNLVKLYNVWKPQL